MTATTTARTRAVFVELAPGDGALTRTVARGSQSEARASVHGHLWRSLMPVELPVLPDLRLDLGAPDVEAPLEVATLLADRTRAGILAILRTGPHCVCEMAAALGERQNNVSNHLARLREAGLVKASRLGSDTRRIYYERDEQACLAALLTLGDVLR